MAFSNNLRGLRTVAMAVLVSGSFGFFPENSGAELNANPLEKNNKRAVAAGKNSNGKANPDSGAKA